MKKLLVSVRAMTGAELGLAVLDIALFVAGALAFVVPMVLLTSRGWLSGYEKFPTFAGITMLGLALMLFACFSRLRHAAPKRPLTH